MVWTSRARGVGLRLREGPLEETGVRETPEMEPLSAQWPGSKSEHHLNSFSQLGTQTRQQIPLDPFPRAPQSPPTAPAAGPTGAHPVLSCLDGSNSFAVAVLLSLLQQLLHGAPWVSF